MKTYRLEGKDIENKPVLAVGYKVFAPEWKTKHGDYCYADENGNVLNTIHTVDGDIAECRWGLHFSKKPQDCFNFYESVQWNKFAKIEAYEECIDSDDGKKSVAKTLKIVQMYTFDEFIRLIQEDLQNLAEELREAERQISKLDEGRKNNMIAIRDLEMTKERLLSFAEYAKDAQPEVLVTLIQTIVERIYIVEKDNERYCHIFIKGCSGEDYTGFFRTAGYIEQKTTPVCDSEQCCIFMVLFTLC